MKFSFLFILLITMLSSCKKNGAGEVSSISSDGEQRYKISFWGRPLASAGGWRTTGIPFTGGAVEGLEAAAGKINCNRTTKFDCEASFPAGSHVAVRIPTRIIADAFGGTELVYGGMIMCNGEIQRIAPSGNYVILHAYDLDQDWACSFHFKPR